MTPLTTLISAGLKRVTLVSMDRRRSSFMPATEGARALSLTTALRCSPRPLLRSPGCPAHSASNDVQHPLYSAKDQCARRAIGATAPHALIHQAG